MTNFELTVAVKAEARRLGFEFVGVTTPQPPAHLDVYQAWIRAGRHAEMGYLANERALKRRAEPRLLLPECQSILVLGVRYPASSALPASRPGETTGQVANYAWGDDYHEVLPERLQALVNFIEDQVNQAVPNRWYSDTGPLLERELAQRAGLGWIGKNTCLINPQHGSYFLLAEILLGISLQPDPPFTSDHCGSCTRCLRACPTSCIRPDRTLDAGRCLSYLTIELKSAIPTELRPKLGNWIFGCDICQQVCPWNQRFAQPHGDPAFSAEQRQPRVRAAGQSISQAWPAPVLVDELALTPEQFRQKFRLSPVKRSKRRGYLRNVAVALGNQALEDSVATRDGATSALIRALDDSEALVRAHAAWALGQIGGPQAQAALTGAILVESEDFVRAEMLTAQDQIELS